MTKSKPSTKSSYLSIQLTNIWTLIFYQTFETIEDLVIQYSIRDNPDRNIAHIAEECQNPYCTIESITKVVF